MTAWFSKKPRLTPRSQFPPEIVRAIHTMADDMAGKEKPEVVSHEPLVEFQPGQTGGAAFYTAPAIQEAPVPDNLPLSDASPTTSPFLNEASPVDIPAVENPIVSESPQVKNENEETVLLNQMRELEEGAPVAVSRLTEDQTEEIGAPENSFSWKEKIWQHKRWLFLGLGVVACLILVFLGWYWWQSREEALAPVVSEGTVKETAPTIEIKVEEEKGPSMPHYVTNQPNLLSFDTETVTANDITTEFLKIALSIKQDNLRQPIEFLVRDQNYNPLAFSRFAYLLGLNFPPEFVNALDESFSIFFFLDGAEPRIGIQVTIKEKEAFTTALSTAEGTLPKILEPFFLDKTTAPKTGLVFRSGVYQEQPVRYTNIDQVMNLSIDYAVRENIWLMGTSQNTLRTLLDREMRE